MGRKIAYWATTIIICLLSLVAAFTYLSGNQQAVEGFAKAGYPQHLRVFSPLRTGYPQRRRVFLP